MGKVIHAFPQVIGDFARQRRVDLAGVADHEVVPRYPTTEEASRNRAAKTALGATFGILLIIGCAVLLGLR